MYSQIITRDQALQIAKHALATRFPGADFGFAAGSIIRGNGTVMSDIDMIVVCKSLPNAYRESFTEQDVPVEAFVHDPETLRWFMREDADSGRPPLLNMLAEGVVIGPAQRESAEQFRQKAHGLLAKGPPSLTPDDISKRRYEITDMLDDLRGIRPEADIVATGAALYGSLADFILRASGKWSGTGKKIPGLLYAYDEALGIAFVSAFDRLFKYEDPSDVIKLTEDALAPYGGRHFNGYRREAPAAWRIHEPEPGP